MPYAELMGPARILANRSSSPRSVLQAMYASVCCAPVNACLLVPAAGVVLCFSAIARRITPAYLPSQPASYLPKFAVGTPYMEGPTATGL